MDFLNRFEFDIVDASGNIIPNGFFGLLTLTILFFMLTVYFFKQNRKNKLELENLKYLEKHKNEILEALKKAKFDITYTTWEIIVIHIKNIIKFYIEESPKKNQFKAENENLQFQVRCLKERVKQLESLNSNKNNNNEAKTISDLPNTIKDKDKLIEDKDKLIKNKDKLIEDKDKLIEDKDKLIEDKDKQLKSLPDLKKRLENSQLLQDERLETIENQKQEISSLEETIKNQKQALSSLEETIMNPNQDISRFEETIENQKQDISRFGETIKNQKQEIVSLKKIINTKNKGNWKYKNKKLVQEIRYLRKLLKRKIMLWPIKEEDLESLNYFY
jgi:DNA repair exonuclease SbcCD ATPase subunit